ncbi:hypothetical protein ACH5RR_001484, partial [Cinchona calisaya]
RDLDKVIITCKEQQGPQGFSFLYTNTVGDQPLKKLDFVDRIGSFCGISSGLVLCGDHLDFHVLNPIMRQLFSLPHYPVEFETINSKASFAGYEAASPGFFSSKYDNDYNDFKMIVPIIDERDVKREN